MELYNTGKYAEAISAFEELDGYKDSAAQIEKCNTAIKDEKYDAAVALYNTKKYTEAISAFEALDGYKNSEAKANEIIAQHKTEINKFATVGDIFYFGSYEQDNNTSNGKEYIKWRVLAKEGNNMLLISEYALDCKQYNTSYTYVTWETCSLRKWLNGTFLNNAFSADEQAKIQSTNVSADKNPDYSTNPGNATTDKVFLLSITEVEKYFASDSARQCKPTKYAVANGAYVNSANGNCRWLLRSPGYTRHDAADVDRDGSVYCDGYAVSIGGGCGRPAIIRTTPPMSTMIMTVFAPHYSQMARNLP